MRKILPFVVIFFVVITNPTPLYAIDGVTDSTTSAQTALRKNTEPLRALKQDAKTDLKTNRLELKSELKMREDTLKTKILEQRRELEASTSAQRQLFKAQLATIKDATKKELVTKIDAKFSTVNTEKTTKMSEALQKLSSALSKISDKATTLKTAGKDTTTLDAAITTANSSLEAAESAVTIQAGKEYVATIGTESTLKTNVGTTMKQLQLDLQTTNKTVITAKQAVMTALMELKKLNGETSTASESAETK